MDILPIIPQFNLALSTSNPLIDEYVRKSTELKSIDINQSIDYLDKAIEITRNENNLWRYDIELKKASYLTKANRYDEGYRLLCDMFNYPTPEALGTPCISHILSIYDKMRIISKKNNRFNFYYSAYMHLIYQGFSCFEYDKYARKGDPKLFATVRRYPELELKLTDKEKRSFEGHKKLIEYAKNVFVNIKSESFERINHEIVVKSLVEHFI